MCCGAMPNRDIDLTEYLDRFIDDTVASGRYKNADEVVHAAIRALQREEQLHEAKLARLAATVDDPQLSTRAETDDDE